MWRHYPLHPPQHSIIDAYAPARSCRTASALWILPKRPAHQTPCVVHLAATGDHGFTRRAHLGLPLVEQVGEGPAQQLQLQWRRRRRWF